eukprot:Opistho-2@42013
MLQRVRSLFPRGRALNSQRERLRGECKPQGDNDASVCMQLYGARQGDNGALNTCDSSVSSTTLSHNSPLKEDLMPGLTLPSARPSVEVDCVLLEEVKTEEEIYREHWRVDMSQQLAARDKCQCAQFATLQEYQPPGRISEISDEDEAVTLAERLLYLETRLHKRTKMSRRSIRLLGAFLGFVLLIAILLSISLSRAILDALDPAADTCAGSFAITSVDTFTAFLDLGCVRVGNLSINGSALSRPVPSPSLHFLFQEHGADGDIDAAGYGLQQ